MCHQWLGIKLPQITLCGEASQPAWVGGQEMRQLFYGIKNPEVVLLQLDSNPHKLDEKQKITDVLQKINARRLRRHVSKKRACCAQDGASPTEDSPAAAVSRGSAGAGVALVLLCLSYPCSASHTIPMLCLSCSASCAHALPLVPYPCSASHAHALPPPVPMLCLSYPCSASRTHALPLIPMLCLLCPCSASCTIPMLCLSYPCYAFCSADFALSLIYGEYHPLYLMLCLLLRILFSASHAHALPLSLCLLLSRLGPVSFALCLLFILHLCLLYILHLCLLYTFHLCLLFILHLCLLFILHSSAKVYCAPLSEM